MTALGHGTWLVAGLIAGSSVTHSCHFIVIHCKGQGGGGGDVLL